MKKRWVISLFFLSFLTSVASAKSIAIQVIQNIPGQEKVWETTRLFEQGVIDYFFDSGNIVTNSPIWIASSDSKNRGALGAALIENSDGGMEYLIRYELLFNITKSSNPSAPLLENISGVEWKVYSVETGKELMAGKGKPGAVNSNNNNELGIIQLASLMAKNSASGLKK